MATIAVIGTLDTKGDEHGFVADCIRARGHEVTLIDVGTGGPPTITPDISRELVAAVSAIDIDTPIQRGDREECTSIMGIAAAALILQLHSDRKIDGVISLGGCQGTAIGTAAMRVLPIGFPKLMVSTKASGNTEPYIGSSDILLFPSIIQLNGINSISRNVLTRAAGAICGMIETEVQATEQDKPIIAASLSGNTIECVHAARDIVKAAGYEVLFFEADSAGGRSMEALIESGMIAGVLDITTTEWADELVGGVFGAGHSRLEAAGKAGIPSVVVPGGLDMVNFGPPDCVPVQFLDRLFYKHNPQVTLMRTTPDECAKLGRIIADKVNAYTGPATVMLPLRGVSAISGAGQPFFHPEADHALFEAIKINLGPGVSVQEHDAEINDPDFSLACAVALLDMLEASR